MNEIGVSQSLVNKVSQIHRDLGFRCGISLICWDSPGALLPSAVRYSAPRGCGGHGPTAGEQFKTAGKLLWNGLFPGKSWSCGPPGPCLRCCPQPESLTLGGSCPACEELAPRENASRWCWTCTNQDVERQQNPLSCPSSSACLPGVQ